MGGLLSRGIRISLIYEKQYPWLLCSEYMNGSRRRQDAVPVAR
jgi:hypothetical protein